ncbi:MAG: O-antigen ligase family protein [Magnetococcales bacterium]|nr:O-antigen ligase family protein [Magnetococcales bacterium]
MRRETYLLTLLFMVFFLANSYHHQLRFFMWYGKFILLIVVGLSIYLSSKYQQIRFTNLSPSFAPVIIMLYGVVQLLQIYNSDLTTICFCAIEKNQYYLLLLGSLFVFATGWLLAKMLNFIEYWNTFKKAIIYGVGFVTYSNIVFYILGQNLGRGITSGRFTGWIDNPNTLGIILLGGFPVVLHEIFLANENKKKLLLGLLFALMVFLLIVTGSRSALMGLVFTIIFMLWRLSFLLRSAGFLLAILLLLFFDGSLLLTISQWSIFSPNMLPTFARNSVDILSGRSEVWQLGWQLVNLAPLFGHGMGAEAVLIEALIPTTSIHQGVNVHNSYLSLLIASGWLGSAPILLLVVLGIIRATANIISKNTQHNNPKIDLISVAFLVFVSHAFFETWIFSPGSVYGFVFWTFNFALLSKPVDEGLNYKYIGV